MPTTTHPRRWLAVLATCGVLALTGCGGDGDGDARPTPTPTPTPTQTVASGVPEGVEITEPGSQLAFGDTATVLHEAGKRSAVLGLTVESAQRGAIKDFVGFDLDSPYKRQGHYYYVRVAVANAGETPIGSTPVPLWGISGDNTLLQPVKFTSSFKKCPTEQLPRRFRPGAEFRTCLVYLSPERGELAGLSYRPLEDSVPIEWRGEVRPAPDARTGGQDGAGEQQ